jgi:hypothetical protein
MKVDLGGGIFIEEKDGRIKVEAAKLPAETTLSRDEFARRVQAACNEELDPA